MRCSAFLALAAAACAMAPRAALAADAAVVLNEDAYFRQHLVFGLERLAARPLKEGAEKLFPGAALARLEKNVRKLLDGRGIDWAKTDWRDVAVTHFSRTQCGVDERGAMMLPALWPPPAWAQPDFDDTTWLCQRLGRLTRDRLGAVAYDMNSLLFRGAYYRTCFLVPEPGRVRDLTVAIRYRGGARILVNGQELARGHLPAGELGPETCADDYPLEAYVAAADELPGSEEAKRRAADGIADLRCDWEEAPVASRKGEEVARRNCMEQLLNQKGWQRIQNQRDRTLGPVPVPARLLRPGLNVLAIETRTSPYHPWVLPTGQARRWGVHGGYTNLSWDHCGLVRIAVRGDPAAAPSALQPPAGVQAWAADPHSRLWTPDFKPLGAGRDVLRFVGARNGTYSGQIGLRADRELAGLKASASDLVSEKGAKIPAAALQVLPMQGQPISMLNYLGEGRCDSLGYNPASPRLHASTGALALHRYRVLDPLPRQRDGQVEPKDLARAFAAFQFFDHIRATWPERVPAGACQPLWVYLRVPADAAAGAYAGNVTVQADGIEPLRVPVRAEVIAWRVPEPREFQTFVQSEQSPYGVARQYQAELWSDRHFQLLESSFRQLARIGNQWVLVPVLTNSELGNREDMMVRWTRKRDGTLAFDYTVLDRYLALAQKHLGRPKVVCFIVMHGCASKSNAVRIADEASGQVETVEVGPAQDATRRPLWRAFALALHGHMKELGLADSMYWGQAFDDVPDKGLVPLLAEAAPEVYWACAGHGRGPDATFRAASRAYGVDLGATSLQGWRSPFLHLLMPRAFGSVICVEGTSTAFTHRVLVDRAIYTGFNGIGRMGADYFGGTWCSGFSGGQWNMVGRSCVQTLWPGADGAEASARHEAMLEGVQEAEARIFLEQALERKVLPDGLAAEAQRVVDRHCHETLYIPGGSASVHLMDYAGDWQARSRRLYQAAAAVAERIGLDVDRTAFGEASLEVMGGSVRTEVTVPALGRRRLALVLRNWSDKPRAWRAAASDPWIVPEKTEGTAAGQQELGIVLDGKALKAGSEVAGTLTVSDVAAGTAYPVRITARVEKAIELKVRQELQFVSGGGSGAEQPKLIRVVVEPVLNVPVGGSDSREYLLVSRAAAKQPWRLASDCRWLTAEPSSGELEPGASRRVRLTARPPDTQGALHEPSLTFTAAGDAVKEEFKVRCYVIPPYQAPAVPAGEAVYLNDLDPKLMTWHVEAGFSRETKGVRPWHISQTPMPNYKRRGDPPPTPTTPFTMGNKPFQRGLWASPCHETVYRVEGAGFAAFAAEVGFHDGRAKESYANLGAVVSFEVYVDGALRAQSGLMRIGDAPRLLVATRLEGAREVKLVTRRDDRVNDWYCVATWGDPRFIRGPKP